MIPPCCQLLKSTMVRTNRFAAKTANNKDEDHAILARADPIYEDLHGLGKQDWYEGDPHNGLATIHAAENPNPDILRTILQYGNRYYTGGQLTSSNIPRYLSVSNGYGPNATNGPDLPGYTSALIQAIVSQHPENVTTLLSAGAHPNGISLDSLSHNAAGFLRLGPRFAEHQEYGMEDPSIYNREHLLAYIPTPQLSPLTQQEIEHRFDCPFPSVFWSEVDFRYLCPVPNADSIPALVAAAEGSDLKILKSLLDAPATDISFWTVYPQPQDIPEPASPSSLAISTPLHAAIYARNLPALSLLLSRGFDPNALPLTAPTRCITPTMAAIVYCDPWNEEAYNAISGHPLADLGIRTPIYDVSILHFAVARLDLTLLETVAADLKLEKARETALGHSLLHIACLPLDESWIQMHSEPIFKSCHETRNLSELEIVEEGAGDYVKARDIRKQGPYTVAMFDPNYEPPPRFSERPTTEAVRDCHRRQMEVVRYLLKNCMMIDAGATDVHGNTAQHYVACHRDVNKGLLDQLRDHTRGEQTWRGAKNRYGFTPAELFESGQNVIEEEKSYWHVLDGWWVKRWKETELWKEKIQASWAGGSSRSS